MKVSVIIPVYNVRKFLQEALNSVINQTYRDLEIILVDDGSDDGSGELCDEYAEADGRIKVIRQSNRGLSAARNVGLDCMTGEAVLFFDPDDAYHPDAIRRLHDAMIEKDADIVFFRRGKYRTEGNMDPAGLVDWRGAEATYTGNEALLAVADGKISVVAWDKLYKAHIWNDLRYPEGHVHEDTYMIFDVVERAKKVYAMSDALIMHRIREGSIMRTRSGRNIRDHILASEHYLEYVKKHNPGVFDAGYLERANNAYVGLMVNYLAGLKKDHPDKKDISRYIKAKIREYRNTDNGKNVKIRIACFAGLYCPWVIRLRKGIKKVG